MAYNYRKKKFYIIQCLLGAALFLLGLALAIFTESQTANFAMLLGGTFSLTGLISIPMMKIVYTPEEQKDETRKESIDLKDERNKRIREKSAWATQRVMLIILCIYVAYITFIPPFNLLTIILGWGLLLANTLLPYVYAFFYSKQL